MKWDSSGTDLGQQSRPRCAASLRDCVGRAIAYVRRNGIRTGAPAFTLQGLRKLLASVVARQGVSGAILRRILEHAPMRGDVLHRHYVSLEARDFAGPLEQIRAATRSLVMSFT